VMDSRCVHSASPITVSARTCQQWQVPLWSWILRTGLVDSKKSNLRVAWRGSQRVDYLCMYVMYNLYIVLCMSKNSGGIVGGGGTINAISKLFSVLCITLLYN
jgi:hypothetical protein